MLFLCHCFPSCRKYIFEARVEDANYNPLPEERPGGFNWGEGQRVGENPPDNE